MPARAFRHSQQKNDLTWATTDITCPTLMIATGDRGEWTAAECDQTAARMPNARSAVITGARSLSPLDRPAELAALVTGFRLRCALTLGKGIPGAEYR